MIPIVMEERMKNPRTWDGSLGINLGTTLYTDFSGNWEQNLREFDKL